LFVPSLALSHCITDLALGIWSGRGESSLFENGFQITGLSRIIATVSASVLTLVVSSSVARSDQESPSKPRARKKAAAVASSESFYSPVSFFWNERSSVQHDATVVRFPIDPRRPGDF